MVQIQAPYFHLAFKRIFSDVQVRRSFGHKIRNLDVDVEKQRKKKKKLASDYINALLRTALIIKTVETNRHVLDFLFIYD
jgi:hypothetical protein